jgi:Uma2 family endonuclease
MQEYIANGARLGWLIDPIDKRVYIYRPGQPVEILDDPSVRGVSFTGLCPAARTTGKALP